MVDKGKVYEVKVAEAGRNGNGNVPKPKDLLYHTNNKFSSVFFTTHTHFLSLDCENFKCNGQVFSF